MLGKSGATPARRNDLRYIAFTKVTRKDCDALELGQEDEEEVRRRGGARLVERGAGRMGEQPAEIREGLQEALRTHTPAQNHESFLD